MVMIRGAKHWFWRAMDSHGEVLDILMQLRRNAQAAKRFVARTITRWGRPQVIEANKLRS
jgi:putative transposase